MSGSAQPGLSLAALSSGRMPFHCAAGSQGSVVRHICVDYRPPDAGGLQEKALAQCSRPHHKSVTWTTSFRLQSTRESPVCVSCPKGPHLRPELLYLEGREMRPDAGEGHREAGPTGPWCEKVLLLVMHSLGHGRFSHGETWCRLESKRTW